LDHLTRPNIVYTSCTAGQKCWGGFAMFLVDAFGGSQAAFKAADADHDGRVSFREAFDYASDANRLEPWYKALPKEVWPTPYAPRPQRSKSLIDCDTWLK